MGRCLGACGPEFIRNFKERDEESFLISERPGSIPAILLFCFVLYCYTLLKVIFWMKTAHWSRECPIWTFVLELSRFNVNLLRSLVSASTLISVMLQRLTHITTDDVPAKESFIDELEYLGYSSQNQSSKTIWWEVRLKSKVSHWWIMIHQLWEMWDIGHESSYWSLISLRSISCSNLTVTCLVDWTEFVN